MWQYNYSDELYHYGVPGMRWGHRKDNTTALSTSVASDDSRRAYYIKKKKVSEMTNEELIEVNKRAKLESTYKKNNPDKLESVKGIVDSTKAGTDQLGRIVDSIPNKRAPRLDLSKSTDAELRSKINRELLERQYNDVFNPARVSKGKQVASGIIKAGGGLLVATSTALSIALAIKQLKG